MKTMIFQDQLDESLKKFRDNIAMEFRNQYITYYELDRLTTQIANWILENVGHGESFIGILVNDRKVFIQAMMGIIKARCVFIPLDSSYPEKRLARIVNQTDIHHVIFHE